MLAVGSQVEVSIEQVERELEKCAVPGFTGSMVVYLRLRPEASLAVWFSTEQTEVKRNGSNGNRSPEFSSVFGDPKQPTDRQLKVRQWLSQEKHRFRLVVTVTKVIADFKNGELCDMKFVSVSE
jgi:hypothetical protein